MNILVAGVGGQGILTATEFIGETALLAGVDVKKSEVHGMAQRGGSVNSHIRFGSRVWSPLIMEGTADCIVSFERMETLRYIHYLKKDGLVIMNNFVIKPVTLPADQYPENIEDVLERKGISLDSMNVDKHIYKYTNIAMVGNLSKHLDFPEETWLAALKKVFRGKEQFLAKNVEVFKQFRGA